MTVRTYRKVQIETVLGDITEQTADAIVNAANRHLAGGGGVDGAIHRRGGPSIMAETAANYPNGCPTGSAVPTGAGRLNAKFVFHAVAPIYSPGRTDCPEQLRSAYYRCLSLAIEKKCRSVAFPSLGTGAYHYPLTEAATIAISTVRQFLDTLPDHNSLEKIIFVLFDSQTCQVFERTLSEILPES